MQKPAISQYPRNSPEYGPVMGYSIRTERWRCTFWRKRSGDEISYTELYDEVNDPAETVNLAAKPEHTDLIASLKKYLPPTGSDSQAKADATAATNKPAKANTAETREERFERLYTGKAQLNLDEYLAKQGGDQDTAKERFNKMDRNKDGIVTKAEFVALGK